MKFWLIVGAVVAFIIFYVIFKYLSDQREARKYVFNKRASFHALLLRVQTKMCRKDVKQTTKDNFAAADKNGMQLLHILYNGDEADWGEMKSQMDRLEGKIRNSEILADTDIALSVKLHAQIK